MRNRFVTYCLLILLLGACKKNPDVEKNDGNGMDRKEVLTHYADSVIIPGYAGFKTHFDRMINAGESFVSDPTINALSSFRTEWANAYIQWQKVELLDFGPAEYYTLRNFYNIYPADTAGMVANYSNTNANLDVPASYSQQGFPALDYLINGVASDDAAIVSYYKGDGKRGAYIQRLLDRMTSLLGSVMSEWNGSYRNTFIEKTGLDISSSTSKMVNGIVLHYERYIRSGKVGIPSGVMLNGVIAPEKVEAFYKKDISLALAQSAHDAYISFFNGKTSGSDKEGPSLKSYLDALDAKDPQSGKLLSQLINEQFNIVRSGMNSLKPSFYEQINTDNEAMKMVFTDMQAAVRMLKVDMTSAMSITITYTDNDGD